MGPRVRAWWKQSSDRTAGPALEIGLLLSLPRQPRAWKHAQKALARFPGDVPRTLARRDPRLPRAFPFSDVLRTGEYLQAREKLQAHLPLARFPSCPQRRPQCLCLCPTEKPTLNVTVNHVPHTVWVSVFFLTPSFCSRVSTRMPAYVSPLHSRNTCRSVLCMCLICDLYV